MEFEGDSVVGCIIFYFFLPIMPVLSLPSEAPSLPLLQIGESRDADYQLLTKYIARPMRHFLPSHYLLDGIAQGVEVHRLGDVLVEAGGPAPAKVIIGAEAAQGDAGTAVSRFDLQEPLTAFIPTISAANGWRKISCCPCLKLRGVQPRAGKFTQSKKTPPLPGSVSFRLISPHYQTRVTAYSAIRLQKN